MTAKSTGSVTSFAGRARFLRGALAEVSRQKAHARGGAAVGERDAELAPDAGGSGDAWDDPNLVPARHERLHLLAAAAEHQRIAALEPDDGRAAAGETEEHLLDLVLRARVEARLLPHVQHVRVGGDEVQDRGRDEAVVHHHVRSLHQMVRLERQQPRVAGTRADEVDAAARRRGVLELARGVVRAVRRANIPATSAVQRHELVKVGGPAAASE